MHNSQLDHQTMLKTLDQLSQTVEVMSSVISRLQQHVETLMRQRAELVDEASKPTQALLPDSSPSIH